MVTADSQTTPYSYITYVIMRLLYVVVHYVMGQIITHIKGQSICTLLTCLWHAYTGMIMTCRAYQMVQTLCFANEILHNEK